jgi:hypothetical protein
MTTPPVSRLSPAQLARSIGAIVVLTLAASVVGTLDWPLPERVYGGWQVAAVPWALVALLVAGTAVCLLVATALTVRDARLPLGSPAGLTWLGIVLAAAAALVFNALVLAADADEMVGVIIPIFHWAFTLVPGLLAGALLFRRGAAVAQAATLGTGVVTVPLFALGFALFFSPESPPDAVPSTLWITAILGAVPLLVAVASATGWGRSEEWRASARVH